MIYVVGPAKPAIKFYAGYQAGTYPEEFVQFLQYSDAATELTGATLVTENQGTVVCAPGSRATKADRSEAYEYDGTTSAWVLISSYEDWGIIS